MVLSISKCAPVAQGIERRFPKPCVGGSNPLGSANPKPLENVDISVLSAVFALAQFLHLMSNHMAERWFEVVSGVVPFINFAASRTAELSA